MKLTMYQIDAFARHIFQGNPAAICPLDKWLPDELMQNIAAENNLSETAFFVEQNNQFHIRWFTPAAEVDLCGHATLASAYVIFNELNYTAPQIEFISRSGLLTVSNQPHGLQMNFPTQAPVECELPALLKSAFKATPIHCLKAEDYIVVFSSEAEIASAIPDLNLLSQLDLRGVCITAKGDQAGNQYDFVCRVFAPKHGINEDPVTGSVYTQLIPYWAEKLNKPALSAKQISARGGEVSCILLNDRVSITGTAVKYMQAELYLE